MKHLIRLTDYTKKEIKEIFILQMKSNRENIKIF